MTLKIAAFPRDPNPYQEALYAEMRRRGARVRYLAKLTPSLTVNLLLLPLELAILRVRGYRVFHLHWTFGFVFTPPIPRSLSRRWFVVVLRVLRTLGMKIAWTAHNVLPHDPVFDDDVAARRALVRACDLVIAHSPEALSELAALGAPASRAVVIPHGPAVMPGLERVPPPMCAQPRTVAFVGKVLRYKGVEELLAVVRDLDVPLKLVVAGACEDDRLRASLTELARDAADRITLRLRFHEDSELLEVFAAAEALVFPFRAVTTSGSVLLGLAAGRPAVIPDLPAFRHLPPAPLFRYPPGDEGLRGALRAVARAPASALVDKATAARVEAAINSWPAIAERTLAALEALLGPSSAGVR